MTPRHCKTCFELLIGRKADFRQLPSSTQMHLPRNSREAGPTQKRRQRNAVDLAKFSKLDDIETPLARFGFRHERGMGTKLCSNLRLRKAGVDPCRTEFFKQTPVLSRKARLAHLPAATSIWLQEGTVAG